MALILVVDDFAAVRETLQRVLEKRLRHEVLLAASGAEAIELWRRNTPDLVVLDVHLPDMNGLELLVQLRAFAPTLPIVVMSGSGREDEIMKDALLLGANAALPKPYRLREMVDAILQALGPDQGSQSA